MQIKILNESGVEEALIGMKFSFQPECDIDDIDLELKPLIQVQEPWDEDDYFWDVDWAKFDKYMETAKKLCRRDGGHNKLLREINVWALIRAPRYWWPEMDQYKVATTTLSKSTVHTGLKRHYTKDDFMDGDVSKHTLDELNYWVDKGDLMQVKKRLPEGFLQTRMWHGNYANIRNIILQRKGHRVKKEWEMFESEMLKQLNDPELLGLE